MNKQQIYRQIQNEYENERRKNALTEEKNRQELYARLPEARDIDEQIKQLGFSLIKLTMRHAPKAEIDEVNSRMQRLAQRKAKAAAAAGIALPEHIYTCPECKDTGYIGSKKCSCMKKKLIRRYYAESNLSHILEYENFSKFDLNRFSNMPYKDKELTPRENTKIILEDVLKEIRSDKMYFNFYFYGNSGLGKTFLCSCIAKYLLDKGYSVIYMTAYSLASLLEKRRFRLDDIQDGDEIINMLHESDLLIIDDLGTESPTAITASEIFNVINSRMVNRRSTVISTNIKISEISSLYSDRVLSRIMGSYHMHHFYGNDLRIK